MIYEPAPYDLLIPVLLLAFAGFGLKLSRHVAPMIVLMLVWEAGGIVALTQTEFFGKTVVKLATTLLLIGSSVFFAALVSSDPERRIALIRPAYVASAVIASLLGVLGYAGVIPGAELFTKYGRAMGPFQDPNVFGPFLILPAILIAQDMLVRPSKLFGPGLLWLLIILLGIFLSGSRAAWGVTVLALLLVILFAFINEPRNAGRMKMLALVGGGGLALVLLLGVILSIPSIADLIHQRAQLVQEYDAGRLGRFERHVIGFFLVQEHPLGIGPFIFGLTYGEDEHNTWLKTFTVYGWTGGFAYLGLVIWTLVATTPLLFKDRPWRPMLAACWAVYVGHLVIHFVIDQDSWRHLFLIYGVLWGLVAAEKLRRRRTALSPAPRPPMAFHATLPRGAEPRPA